MLSLTEVAKFLSEPALPILTNFDASARRSINPPRSQPAYTPARLDPLVTFCELVGNNIEVTQSAYTTAP